LSVASQRRRENEDTSILLLVETNLTLSKAIQNLIIKQDEIIQILHLLIDNIFVVWWTAVSANDWYSNGNDCAPLLADLFLHAYETDFFKSFSRIKIENESRPLIPTSTI
jgi:hypothetical protein